MSEEHVKKVARRHSLNPNKTLALARALKVQGDDGNLVMVAENTSETATSFTSRDEMGTAVVITLNKHIFKPEVDMVSILEDPRVKIHTIIEVPPSFFNKEIQVGANRDGGVYIYSSDEEVTNELHLHGVPEVNINYEEE
jgi:hypothetical protein